jgi:Big-like domain-containing protein
VTFTVTVASKYGSPADGELVTFSEGKKILGSAPTVGRVAVFTISTFTAKKHTIKATYGGNTTLLPCHRSIVQVVEP